MILLTTLDVWEATRGAPTPSPAPAGPFVGEALLAKCPKRPSLQLWRLKRPTLQLVATLARARCKGRFPACALLGRKSSGGGRLREELIGTKQRGCNLGTPLITAASERTRAEKIVPASRAPPRGPRAWLGAAQGQGPREAGSSERGAAERRPARNPSGRPKCVRACKDPPVL